MLLPSYGTDIRYAATSLAVLTYAMLLPALRAVVLPPCQDPSPLSPSSSPSSSSSPPPLRYPSNAVRRAAVLEARSTPLSPYALPMRCPYGAISLRAAYAPSGTELRMTLSAYAMCGTDLGYGAISLRACYAVCGTDLVYHAISNTRCPGIALPACYAMCGTELAYDATRSDLVVSLDAGWLPSGMRTTLGYATRCPYCTSLGYAMSGTEIAYQLRDVRVSAGAAERVAGAYGKGGLNKTGISLRRCYAMSGTDMSCGTTRRCTGTADVVLGGGREGRRRRGRRAGRGEREGA
eukprot:1520927-Rhodomonas_salina.1